MPIYFDHNATTHLDARVLEAMMPYLSGPAANPSSLHRYGRLARDAIEAARVQVAQLVGAQPRDVIWTSGGTEANNYAIKGVMQAARGRVLYGATEHPAVMEAAESLRAGGCEVEAIPVDRRGIIEADALAAQLAILAEGAQTTAAIAGTPEAAVQARAAAATLIDAAGLRG